MKYSRELSDLLSSIEANKKVETKEELITFFQQVTVDDVSGFSRFWLVNMIQDLVSLSSNSFNMMQKVKVEDEHD